MSTTFQPASQTDPKPFAKPITYRVMVDATWKQLWPTLVLVALYLTGLSFFSLSDRRPLTWDFMSSFFAVMLTIKALQYLFHSKQRSRYQQEIKTAETLADFQLGKNRFLSTRTFFRVLGLSSIVLALGILVIVARTKAPIPLFVLLYLSFLLVEIAAVSVTAWPERILITTLGPVYEDRIFSTFYPWASLKEITWISDTKKLRIECQDIPGSRTIPLGHLSDADRDRLFDLMGQHDFFQRQ